MVEREISLDSLGQYVVNLVDHQRELQNLVLSLESRLAKVEQLESRVSNLETNLPTKVSPHGAESRIDVADPQLGVDGQNQQGDRQTVSSAVVPVNRNAETEAKVQEDQCGRDLDEASYELKESVWDAMLLVGFPSVPIPISMLLSLVALGNTFVQICMVLIIYFNMVGQDPFNENTLHSLEHWRAWVGHWQGYADSQKQTSLAQHICAQKPSETQSGLQSQIYGDVEQFLQMSSSLSAFESFMGGRTLSYLAVLCWLVLVLDEIYDIPYSFFAFHQLPRGKPHIDYSGGQMRIQSYSNIQLMVVSLVMFLPRIVCSCLLGFTGVLYLGKTANVGDLVLNTTALSFVLELDVLFYRVLIPERTKYILSNVAPLRINAGGLVRKIRVSTVPVMSLARILYLAAMLLLVHYTVVHPFHEDLIEVQRILCGGNTNFIYGYDNGTMVAAKTREVTSDKEHTPDVLKLLGHIFDGPDTLGEVEFSDLLPSG